MVQLWKLCLFPLDFLFLWHSLKRYFRGKVWYSWVVSKARHWGVAVTSESSWFLHHGPWWHYTRSVYSSLSYLSASFNWSCISRLTRLNCRLNYIIPCSENCPHFHELALFYCSSLPLFPLKKLCWDLERVGEGPGTSRTSPSSLAFSLSVGLALLPCPQERR